MFQRQMSVQYSSDGGLQPCPIKWLDSFSMRNFTNDAMFDDTLPVADGLLKVGARVSLDRLKSAMEDWFRKKSYLPPGASLVVTEKPVTEKPVTGPVLEKAAMHKTRGG